jgi:hypothetical protein
VLAAFHPALRNGFVDYDDDQYVTANPHVQRGLAVESLRWAWASFDAANWHPITWMSHMLDWQLFGPRPAGHHATSLLLHLANTLLLFFLLDRATRSRLRSAAVALLFGVHPLHVESVAWVAERKDVLSTFFWLLTAWAYVRYVEAPRTARYAAVLLGLAVGLAAKPMLVTLPFTLLLLDVWPLERRGRPGMLLLEKLPLAGLSLVSCLITIAAQRAGQAIVPVNLISFPDRLANAAVACVAYLGKTLLPVGLAALYPHPRSALPAWEVAGAALLLIAITAVAIRLKRRAPYLAVGWLWYLGTLVPVVGLVQVGEQAMADRYTYVPLVGIFVIIAWGVPAALDAARVFGARGSSRSLALALLLVTPVLIGTSWARTLAWRDSVTLWQDETLKQPLSARAHYKLGFALAAAGRGAEAVRAYGRAIDLAPDYAEAYNNRGNLLGREGRDREALQDLDRAVALGPRAEAYNNRGIVRAHLGDHASAVEDFDRAIALKPDYGAAHGNRAVSLWKLGQYERAWSDVEESRRVGWEPPPAFLRALERASGRSG